MSCPGGFEFGAKPNLITWVDDIFFNVVTHRKNEKESRLADWREGWAWIRLIRPQESLVLYKSFNTLWSLEKGEDAG
jgi:hypothetical protein